MHYFIYYKQLKKIYSLVQAKFNSKTTLSASNLFNIFLHVYITTACIRDWTRYIGKNYEVNAICTFESFTQFI